MDEYKAWAIAACIRAIKTAAQTAASLIGTGAVGFTDLDWVQIASISGVVAVASLLTSVAGVPEVAGGASVGKLGGRVTWRRTRSCSGSSRRPAIRTRVRRTMTRTWRPCR